MEKERNFSQLFEIIYDKFIEECNKTGSPSGTLAFGKFLGHGHDGRIRAWKKGQWPSAEDCWNIEKKLGFNLRWLVTGQGPLFNESAEKEWSPGVTSSFAELVPTTESQVLQLEHRNAELTQKLLRAYDEIMKLNAEKRELEKREKVPPSFSHAEISPQAAIESKPAPSASSEALRETYNKQ